MRVQVARPAEHAGIAELPAAVDHDQVGITDPVTQPGDVDERSEPLHRGPVCPTLATCARWFSTSSVARCGRSPVTMRSAF